MKRKLLVLLSILSLSTLTACGVSQADYEAVFEENEQLKSENQELNEQLQNIKIESNNISEHISSYSNTSISFNYNSKTLAVTELENGAAIYDINTDPISSNLDKTIMIMEAPFDLDMDAFATLGLLSVDTVFDSLFSVVDSELSAFINAEDNFHEYKYIDDSNTLCRGKIFSLGTNNIYLAYCKISRSASSEVYNSLNECFDSIMYLGDNPWHGVDYEKIEKAEQQAKKAASEAEWIEDGEIYDSISGIIDSFDIIYTPSDNGYNIGLYLDSDSIENNSTKFVSLCEEIYTKSLPKNCSVMFSLNIDDDWISSLSITNDGKCMGPITTNEDYEQAISNAYYQNSFFCSIDIEKHFENELNSIIEKYQ